MTVKELREILCKDTTIILVDGPNSICHSTLGTVPVNSLLLSYIQYRTISEIECIGEDKLKVYLKP